VYVNIVYVFAIGRQSALRPERVHLALSGPEIIETVATDEEFDSKDRALVWRVICGRHRYVIF